MKLYPNSKRDLLKAALGKIPSDFAITNIQYVNVFTGEVYPAVVYVYDGFVAHVEHFCSQVEQDRTKEVVDGQGRYLIPGFIDAHIHIESSMMIPRRFAEAVIPRGTTTVITDPHEMANVYGEEAVVYMHDSADGLPMRQLIDIPSCVPAVPGLEQAGASFDADVIRRLAKLPRVVGLAEVMDFVGVAQGDDRMMDIIQAAEENGLYIQGHLPAADPRLVSAYMCGGPTTCHETRTAELAALKMRSGMFVDARQSSISFDVKEVLRDTKDFPWLDHLCLCTDDREADDILHSGHMDFVAKFAVACGLSGVQAVRSATYNTAREANLKNLGAVAPGYVADMLLVDDLVDFRVASVYYGGKLVAQDGKLLADIPQQSYPIETRDSMNVPELTLEDFRMKAPAGCGGAVNINILNYASLESPVTDRVVESVPVKDGYVDISGDPDLLYVLIANRYGAGNMTFGLARGFGLQRGANGTTVSHDSHNLCILFRDAQSGYEAYKALKSCGGGMCCVNGDSVTVLPLPVGGLMSTLPCKEVAAQGDAMKKALAAAGMPQKNPLLRIVSLALPVIPTTKFSDLGLVDVMSKTLIPIFVD